MAKKPSFLVRSIEMAKKVKARIFTPKRKQKIRKVSVTAAKKGKAMAKTIAVAAKEEGAIYARKVKKKIKQIKKKK